MRALSYQKRRHRSRLQSADCDFRMQNAECRLRLQNAECRNHAPLVCAPCHAFHGSFSKDPRCASAKQMHSHPGDTSSSDFEFNPAARALQCRVQVPRGFHCRVRLRLQNADPRGASKLKCETSLQNAECRVPGGQDIEVRDFTSECRMQSAGRARN